MRLLITTFIALFLMAGNLSASNTKQTIAQVTSAVTITDDVDYIITDDTPFTTAGSVNIENTTHAVVIIKRIKPSIVIKSWMSHIYINGERAVNGTNCQVRMYDRGAIVFPYDKDFKPLTCYTEKGFQGESSDNYSIGSNGGFMKDLSTATLNNNFQSFKLKRGYMVTFALGKSGWGYSRCFIADQEDLEMDLPANMNGRVSSYRLFHWYNAHKAGLASNGDYNANAAVNSSWCYDWAQGNESNLPDVEWVPNHIYEDWPSPATCGGVTGSCHMKTNNEPGNSADDHPQSVDVVLDNWQNLMRTGMRLCSESSHDGSMNHLKAFIDSIDARGWRCDLLDLHCYWASGSFNSLTWYSDNYGNGRPIWISEWIWGASWNHNGAFGDGVTDAQILSETKNLLNILNTNARVERYAYWNSESKAHIYENGALTDLGRFYATMDDGMGYNASIQKVPNVVCLKPQSLTATYNASTGNCTLKWDDPNGDMLDSLTVECMRPGTTKYVWIGNVKPKDATSKTGANYTFTDSQATAGANYYRIAAYPIGSKTPKYSGAASVSVTASAGNETIQYGRLDVTDLDAITVNFNTAMTTTPAVFMGIASNKNATMNPVTLIDKASTKSFTYQMIPWAYTGSQTLNSKENVSFMALVPGNYKYDQRSMVNGQWSMVNSTMDVEVGTTKVKSDTVQVTFQQPFPEGVLPVVIAEARPNIKTNTVNIRIWDVTNTGFKIIALYEGGMGKNIAVNQTVNYMACTVGQAKIADNVLISAGFSEEPLYGKSPRRVIFQLCNLDGTIPANADSLALDDPLLFGALQTFNYPASTVLRRSIDINVIDETGRSLIYGTRIIRNVDTSAGNYKNDLTSADRFGWICLSTLRQSALSEDVNGDGIVDTQDVLAVYQYIQSPFPSGEGRGEADVNHDGIVDTQDVLRIYDYIMNH